MNGFRLHMVALLKAWEKDNSLVYFNKVPPSVPSNKALKAIDLKKAEEFVLEQKDPLPLGVPVDLEPPPSERSSVSTSGGDDDVAASNHSTAARGGDGDLPPPSYDLAMAHDSRLETGEGRERSDSDLARELSERLNT